MESETTVGAFGPNVLVLSTSLTALGVTVTTTYVGAEDTDTVAIDLALCPKPAAMAVTRTMPRREVRVTHARDRCLLEHLQRVQTAIELCTGRRAQVETGDDALARVAVAPPSP